MASHGSDDRAVITILVGIVGLLVTAVGVVVSFTVPEVRRLFNLDPPRSHSAVEAERRALEDAVRALEAEKAKGAATKAKLDAMR